MWQNLPSFPIKNDIRVFSQPCFGYFCVAWRRDFRWKPSLIPWCELLQVLEGDVVHFPSPKNVVNRDIVLEKDTPFFATSDAPLVLINDSSIDRVNTEMMQVRWRVFMLHRQIPQDEQKELKPCNCCFSKFILTNSHQ